jgi:hypothetical protein
MVTTARLRCPDAARRRGDFDAACIYAGQGVGLLDREQAAAAVVAEFARAEFARAAGDPVPATEPTAGDR